MDEKKVDFNEALRIIAKTPKEAVVKPPKADYNSKKEAAKKPPPKTTG